MSRFTPILALLLASCSLFGKEGANELGGKTDLSISQAGNVITPGAVTISGPFTIPGATAQVDASLTVTGNEGGEVTADVRIDLQSVSQYPGFQTLYDAIPDRYKDDAGNIVTELRFKVTSEGILDYANMDGEPHTLVKYDDPVGTRYAITKSNGRTLTREVVAKSTTDDFPYGFMNIKVSTVEMPVNSGGVRTVTYRANHKYGIVHVEATLDDGSTVSSYLYSAH